jgi:uncharacterized protein (TIGR02596 family)
MRSEPADLKCSNGTSRAFSLTELLVVVAIMATILTLAVPSTSSILENSNLTMAAQAVADQISLARQIASTKNKTVEVRIIMMSMTASTGSNYNAVQLWTSNAVGVMKPAASLVRLPQTTAISQNAKLSKLLSVATTGTISNSGPITDAAYAALHIGPSGTVSASGSTPAMANTYLAVVPLRLASRDSLPSNYAIVQINPKTGTPKVFRP